MKPGPRHSPIDVALRCDLPVGVVRWTGSPPRLTVIVKASMSLEGAGAWLSGHQASLSLDRDSPHSPNELLEASDFAPYKPRADVIVVGSAHADSLVWAIPIMIRVGPLRRELFACTDRPRTTIPLAEGFLREGTEPTADATRVGPRSPRSPERSALAEEPFDWGFFNAAPREQQLEAIPEDAEIELCGLIRGAPRMTTRLPAMRPRVHLVDGRRIVGSVAIFCDTLVIDTDRSVLSLTWRGVCEVEGLSRPSLLVGCGTTDTAPSEAELLAELGDATWTIAMEAPEEEGAHDAPEEPEPPPRPAPPMRLGASFRLGGALAAPMQVASSGHESTPITVNREDATQITQRREDAARAPASHEESTQITTRHTASMRVSASREESTQITVICDEPTATPDLLPFARAAHPIAPPPLVPVEALHAPVPVAPSTFARLTPTPPPPMIAEPALSAFARPITEPPPPEIAPPPAMFARPTPTPPPPVIAEPALPAFARPITEPPPPMIAEAHVPMFARAFTEPTPPPFARPMHEPTPPVFTAPQPAFARPITEPPLPMIAPAGAASPDDLSIETYASIQAAVWSRTALAEVLSQHRLDEHAYRVGAARLLAALSADAREGRHDRLLRLSAEIRRRTATLGAGAEGGR